MATVYDIIKGINQAAANAYDGSQYEEYSYDGEAREIGLKREKGNPITDSRVMDGFSVTIPGKTLCVHYQSELPMAAIHDKNFETEIEQNFADIVKYLKKEYKKIVGETLSLKETGDTDISVQNMSRIRTWVQAKKYYAIGGMDGVESTGEASEEKLDQSIKDFLEIGKKDYSKAKKPSNVTRKAE